MNRGERQPRTTGPFRPPEGHDSLLTALEAFPRQRTYLLPALLTIQHEVGWLPDWAIEYAAAHLRVPKTEAYGAASSFAELRLTEPPAHVLRVCAGSACRLAGGDALRREVAEAETADCLFICALAPAAEIDGRLIGRATADQLRV